MDTSGAGMDTYTGNSNVKVLKSSVSQKVTSVDLTIGKAEVIYLSRPASRVSVSNPEVATAVIISPTQIQLVGKGVGVANLLVWGDMVSPDHTIVDINVHKDVSVLINQLRYVDPGIQIVPMAAEDTVILTGQAETRETAQLAIEMAKAFFSKSTVGAPQTGNGPNSQAPGSAVPGVSANVINLLKVKGEPSTKIELVRQRMRELDPNVRIEVVPGPEGNEKVILTGRVATASIASKALNLASVFYGQPGMKMITAQGGNDYTRMQVSTESTSQGSGSSSNSQSGNATAGANMLQGSVVTDATGNVISMLEIAQKPQIRCSIKFLELNKTGLNALGGTVSAMSGNTGLASWSGVQSPAPGKAISALSTQDMSGSAFSSLINRFNGTSSNTGTNIVQSRFNEVYQNGITQVLTINNQVAMAIQALQEKRQVRTLAEPTLTLLSGEQGSFLAGGEIPIAFVGGQGQVSIEYKEFGIRLNLLPNVTDDGKIQMQVAPEVSSLDQANGVSTNSVSVPAFVTSRMNTTLLVEPGQSFVLAGLYNQQDTDSMSRFPGLGAIPVLGSFFKNTWSNRSKSEMVVVIRPEIINSNTGNASPQTSLLPATPQTAEVSKK
jgi:Flp pilus assembly secretin CpaC